MNWITGGIGSLVGLLTAEEATAKVGELQGELSITEELLEFVNEIADHPATFTHFPKDKFFVNNSGAHSATHCTHK